MRQGFTRISLAGRTTGDVQKIMIFGESGIIQKAPAYLRPRYIVSKKQLEWPTGAISPVFTSDEPDAARGHQHEKIWADELAAWIDLETWDQLLMGLRIGAAPQAIVTTTPRRMKLLRELLKDVTTAVTRGRTFDNAANLSQKFLQRMELLYGGTELGRQELDGEVLEDKVGAYWTQDLIDRLRVNSHPELTRIVIGVDPAVTNNKRSDRIGIVVVGLGKDGHLYVLADLSMKGSPGQWVDTVLAAYRRYGANLIVAETNRGGDLIEHCIRVAAERGGWAPQISTMNSQEGKGGRAEPVSTMYEKGLVHHVGKHPELEDEQCDWDPTLSKYSPNALDALVFACTELMPSLLPHLPELHTVQAPDLSIYEAERPSLWLPGSIQELSDDEVEAELDGRMRGGFFRR